MTYKHEVQIGQLGQDDAFASRNGAGDGRCSGGESHVHVFMLLEVGVVCANCSSDGLDVEEEEAVEPRN